MSTEVSTETAPSVPETKTPRDNLLQSKALANDIAQAERLIQSVLGKPELLAALAPIGYNDGELNNGLALFRTAQEKFSARQQALASATENKAARDRVLTSTQNEFSAYRQTVQVNYKGADRANLGADGKVHPDIEKFRTTARSAYTAALKSPYVDVLSKYGFHAQRITDALTALDQLAAADSACKSAQGTAHAATEARDNAGAALDDWMIKFRKLSKAALKNRPELLSLMKE